MPQIAIISENNIFTALLKSFIQKKFQECSIIVFCSFAELKEQIDYYNLDIIVADSIMSGTASFEIINFLRLEKKIVCPVYFFSEVHSEDFKSKAFETGVNYYYEKPFDPESVTDDIHVEFSQSENPLL